MALADIASALDSSALLARFKAAALKSAGYVITEDPGTTNHALRMKWATRVLCATGAPFLQSTAQRMLAYGLATNATLQDAGAAALDTDIEYVIAVILGDAATLGFVTALAVENEY